MPNRCTASYVFEGNKEEIADLYNKLQSLESRETPLVENGFGKMWLGCIVSLFGGDCDNIYCRGEIDYMDLTDETTLSLSTTTAWGDLPEVWDFVCVNYPSIKYYFSAEECGNGYYATNDAEGKFFPERFHVEQCNEGTEFYETVEEVFSDISGRLGVHISSKEEMDAALEAFNKANEDDWISVNEFKIINHKTTA